MARGLTDAVLQETIDAVRQHGTVSGASIALGIPYNTFFNRFQAAIRSGYVDPRVRVGQVLPQDTQDKRVMQREVDDLKAALTAARSSRVPVYKPAVRKSSRKDDRIRVIIPDSHGCYADPQAVAAFLADLTTLDPDEVVMLGDHVDCGGFLAAHHTMGYVAQMEYSYEDDIAATATFLNAIQEAAPRATIDYLEGNHEQRVERWCVTQALATRKDAEYLRKNFAPEYLLKLTERGIKYHRRSETHDGLPVPGTIKRGRVYFIHEMGASKNAAASIIRKFGASVVFGHTHRAQSDIIRTVTSGTIGAWSPGCLCVQQPLYCHTTITDWSHGYGVELIAKSGDFLHINVPIVDGASKLLPLTRRMIA